ncbi:uncharacterized protein [Nicotiana tomentosiformis]|uniref:uncharacterized protein n=1 Tax=Nicotiana tomentosiformis TaxID=4098 RepID=UPI00388C8C4E
MGDRGQSSRPPFPSSPPPRGALVQPYFSVMPESSYRPPAIQGSSSGYSGVFRESLDTHVYVSTHMGHSVIVDRIYQSCIVTFCGYKTRADLLRLEMTDFEIILSMDSLSPYHAILDCHAKIVTLVMPELPRLEWKGLSISASNQVISFLKARHMVDKGYLSYLAYVQDTTAETLGIDLVSVVWEFSDVFPLDLPGMPPDHDIDFCIDLAPDT